jgi:hypothetical protein
MVTVVVRAYKPFWRSEYPVLAPKGIGMASTAPQARPSEAPASPQASTERVPRQDKRNTALGAAWLTGGFPRPEPVARINRRLK